MRLHEVTRVGERDNHSDDRRRPAGPAWATVPTMTWTRIVPAQRDDADDGPDADLDTAAAVPVSPALSGALARPVLPRPRHEERHDGRHEERPEERPDELDDPPIARQIRARQILGPGGQPPADLLSALTEPTATGGQPVVTEEAAAADPERVLSAWQWQFDPDTLREVADDPWRLREIRDQLTGKLEGRADNAGRARLLSLRAVVSRILGELPQALADAKLALAHAEATGELRRIAIAQARLAHVLQWQGEYDEADRLFTLANSTELPDRLRATMHQHFGKSAYDQGRYIEACNHFERALELRKTEDPELIAQTELALDAVFRKVAENGWGPYPRTRDELLQLRKPPSPVVDESTGRFGFADADGNVCIPVRYADVQPFRDGVAWVQRPGYRSWELIDEAGETLIPTRAGYTGVSSFSDGLAWVSKDDSGRWIAVDRTDTVTIPTGFDDIRPFRRGMAAVRHGPYWGAVDAVGRVVVPFEFDAFATAMSDGRYIDGFSDEGLAVVERQGRKGVVDRTGRMLVDMHYPALVIHPVAFLITDAAGRWGALDRRGRPIIRPSHPSRMAVTEEIDRLLADTRPML